MCGKKEQVWLSWRSLISSSRGSDTFFYPLQAPICMIHTPDMLTYK